ncbi:hypothetical protein [Plasmodium yoelii yoelii]|uniref:Uncharacterized protein n=1 Tax=Plasmodium yoelii yoelii TaxID=73239 RepID=Q7R7E7_PLAYO|nr:hypothetical protein [Plasmodium yoelii yoelii]
MYIYCICVCFCIIFMLWNPYSG